MRALRAVRDGLRVTARSWGLVLLLLGTNLATAAVLAVPLAGLLEEDLKNTDAANQMMYDFDYGWWSHWSESRPGWPASFGPEIFGIGFAFRNLDLLLRGDLPAGLFRRDAGDDGEAGPGVDRVILALGAAYLALQTFLAGGVLGVLRGAQGRWTVRGLLHGSGFYFGRFARIAVLALLADGVLFLLNAPFARWADGQAREAVSEASAEAWLLGRHALLLLAILCVHMVSSYAKVIVVLEERASALLAFLSALSFCLARPLRTAGHYFTVAALGAGLLLIWHALDAGWATTGYKTQIVTLLLAQGLLFGRVFLRLTLWGGQLALYRRED